MNSMNKSNSKKSFDDILRQVFKGLLEAVAKVFLKMGLTANAITFVGLIGTIVAAVLIALDKLFWGGLLLLFMAPLDAVDGTMARLSGKNSSFGAFFDSFIDRYDELFIYAGLMYWFSTQENVWGVMLCFAAASGAVLVSYARARAEALGFEAKIGLMTRVGRAIVMIAGLLFGIIVIALVIIAVLAHITAMMRMITVWKQAKSRDSEPNKKG